MIKKIIKKLLDEFVYRGHLIALGAVSVVSVSAILLNIKITWDCLIVVYIGTQSIYLHDWSKNLKGDYLTNPERVNYIKRHTKYTTPILFFLNLIAIAILIYSERVSALIFYCVLLLVGLLYGRIFKQFTKRLFAFKNFFVALMWSLLIILFAVYYSFPFNFSLLLIVIFVYLRAFINTVSFDVKDISSDDKENLLTPSILLGKRRFFYFLNMVNILALIPMILGFYFNLFSISSLVLAFLTSLYAFYYLNIIKYEKVKISYLSHTLILGEKILWLPFILLSEFLITL